MNLLEFEKQYPDEASCRLKWKELREKEGVVCPKCGSKEHYWKKDKESFECKHCKHRQSLRANTIMHGSQLPFRYWFITIHLLTSTKHSFSSREIQHQLGHKFYEPIWAMVHKIREAMGKRDDKYTLLGELELDEGFFTIQSNEKGSQPLKRGCGNQRKAKVLVCIESERVDSNKKKSKGKKERKSKYLKMKVIKDLKSETIDDNVKKYVSKESKIYSDASTSYVHLKDLVSEHHSEVISKAEVGKVLPWVHIAISNAKRLFLDIYHSISAEILQNYLNEFCYKFNRRYFGDKLFDRLLIAGVCAKNTFRYRIR